MVDDELQTNEIDEPRIFSFRYDFTVKYESFHGEGIRVSVNEVQPCDNKAER